VAGGEAPAPETAGAGPVPIVEGLFALPTAGEPPRLLASRCTVCGETFFPQRRFCARCSSPNLAEVLLGPSGRLYTYTVVYELFAGLDSFGPYAVGQVEMDGSPRVQGLITGCDFDALKIDMALELTLLPLGTDEHGRPRVTYAFRPAQPKEGAP
jgi:uncharacterized OB-fold protein